MTNENQIHIWSCIGSSFEPIKGLYPSSCLADCRISLVKPPNFRQSDSLLAQPLTMLLEFSMDYYKIGLCPDSLSLRSLSSIINASSHLAPTTHLVQTLNPVCCTRTLSSASHNFTAPPQPTHHTTFAPSTRRVETLNPVCLHLHSRLFRLPTTSNPLIRNKDFIPPLH